MSTNPTDLTRDANYSALQRDAKGLQEANSLLANQAALLKQIADAEQNIANQRAAAAAEQDLAKQEKMYKDIIELEKSLASTVMDTSEKKLQYEEEIRKLKDKVGDIDLEHIKNLIEANKLIAAQEELYSSIGGAIEKAFKPLEKLGIPIGKIGDGLRKASKARKGILKMGDNLTEVGGKMGPNSKLGKGMVKLGSSMQGVAASGVAIGVALVGIAVVLAAFAIVGKVLMLALSFDKLSKDLERSTGGLGDMSASLKVTSSDVAMMGASSKEVSEAYKDLINNFSDFSIENKKINRLLTKTTVTLSKMGVSTKESTNMIDFMTKAMGKSAEASAELTVSFLAMGQKVGITTSKMAENFKALESRIVLFGNNAGDVLRNFSALSKATGVSVSELQGLATKFDTFESAADSVQKLNAVMGTQMSTMDMMQMRDDEKIAHLQREMRMRGITMKQMDKHSQLFVAQAIGMSDVSKAQRLIDMDPKKYEETTAAMEQQQVTQAALQAQAESLVPLQEKFAAAMNDVMLTLLPMGTKMMKHIVEPFVKFVSENRRAISFIAKVTVAMAALVAVFVLFTSPLFLIPLGITLLGAGLAWAGAKVAAFYDEALTMFGLFTRRGSPIYYDMPRVIGENFKSMGDMASKAGELLKNPIKSLGGLWDIFHKEGSPELYKLPQTFADNFASIEESVSGTMNSMTRFISIMKEFASLDFDGFIAVSSGGGSTSLVMGSDGIIKQMSEGKLQVDVKMPEIQMPPIQINVIVNEAKLKGVIKAEVHKTVGRSG